MSGRYPDALYRPQARIMAGLLGSLFVGAIVVPKWIIPAQFRHPAGAHA